MKTIPNSPILKAWLERSKEHRELAKREAFTFEDDLFAKAVHIVAAHHPTFNQASIDIRAALQLLMDGHSGEARELEPEQEIVLDSLELRLPSWVRKWAIAVLILLGIIAFATIAKAEPEPTGINVVRNSFRGYANPFSVGLPLAEPATGGVVIQLKNGGSTLATRGGGLVVFNCTGTLLTCSFSGSTFTLNGSGGFSNPMTTLGDTIYGGASGIATRLAGSISASTLCLTQTGNGSVSAAPVWGSCAGSSSTIWSALSNPTANLSLAHAAFTTTFTWNAATGAGVSLLSLTDTANNTGTGFLFDVNLASGSAAKPGRFAVNGNGWNYTNAGLLAPIGTGALATPGAAHNVVISQGASAAVTYVPPVAAGKVLIDNGPGNDPSFQDPVISYNNPSETTAAWTSATANNTVLSVTLPAGTGVLSTVMVTLNQGSTITGGAVAFLASDTTGLTNTYPVYCIPQGAGTGPVSSYTLTASTNIAFQCSLSSFEAFEIKLSPAISGTATVNVGIQPTSAPSQAQVAVVNFPATQPVSGTVTANLGTLNGAATAANQCGTSGPCEVSATTSVNGATNPLFMEPTDGTNAMGAMTNFGTTPGAVKALNVNSSCFVGTTACTTGTGASGSGIPRVTVSADSGLYFGQTSYHTSANFAASSTTDNFVFPGNATNTVLITSVKVSCTQTTAGIVLMKVIKRSAADTSGTSAAVTPVPDDSNYAAAVSAPLSYTGTGPSVGAAVGTVDEYYLGCLAAGTASPNDIYILNLRQKPIVLRGTAQQLAINFGGALTGGNLNVTIDHIESTTITP